MDFIKTLAETELTCSSLKVPHKHATAHIDNAVASSATRRQFCAWKEQTKNEVLFYHDHQTWQLKRRKVK